MSLLDLDAGTPVPAGMSNDTIQAMLEQQAIKELEGKKGTANTHAVNDNPQIKPKQLFKNVKKVDLPFKVLLVDLDTPDYLTRMKAGIETVKNREAKGPAIVDGLASYLSDFIDNNEWNRQQKIDAVFMLSELQYHWFSKLAFEGDDQNRAESENLAPDLVPSFPYSVKVPTENDPGYLLRLRDAMQIALFLDENDSVSVEAIDAMAQNVAKYIDEDVSQDEKIAMTYAMSERQYQYIMSAVMGSDESGEDLDNPLQD